MLQTLKEVPSTISPIKFLDKVACIFIWLSAVGDKESRSVHWGYHPGGALWEAQLQKCLLQSDLAASVSKTLTPVKVFLCVQKQNIQTGSSHWKMSGFPLWHLWAHNTPHCTFFDIFSWGFSHHWGKQLMQKNTLQGFSISEQFTGWPSQLIRYSVLDENLQGCWFKEHYTQHEQLLQLLSSTFLRTFLLLCHCKRVLPR